MQQNRRCFTHCYIIFQGNRLPSWSAQDHCFRPRRQVRDLLFEDIDGKDGNQAVVLHIVPAPDRWPNRGGQPKPLYTTVGVDQAQPRELEGVHPTRRVRLQSGHTPRHQVNTVRDRRWLQALHCPGHVATST